MPSTTGSHGDDRLEAAPTVLGRGHADVHMQPLDALAAHRDAAVADERHVALLLDDRLSLGARERMRRRRCDRETLSSGRGCSGAPQRGQRLVDLRGRRADIRVDLEHRGEELGLQRARAARDHRHRARMRSTAATWPKVSASRIISSSSTPSENGAVSPNRCVEDHDCVCALTPCTGRPGRDPGVVRRARARTRSGSR